jgi:hypothetical protein
MPTKKKVETEATAAEPKPAKRTAKKAATETKADPARKTAAKPAAKPATAAATHKAPAKRPAAANPAAPAFSVDAYRAEIEREAYLIWAGRGHKHGQAHEDWLRAIEIVKSRYQK